MSTQTLTTLTPPDPVSGGPSLPTLIRVELRKMLDTRAGLWTALGVVGLTVIIAAVRAFTAQPEDQTLQAIMSYAIEPAGLLLPAVGVLLVASEWSQRTALNTFTLVPQRGRVLSAKLGAAVVLGAGMLAVSFAVAASGTLLASPDIAGAWSMPLGLAAQYGTYLVISMLIGVAFGAATLVSAPAIVLYFALPLGITAATSLSFLKDAGAWIDTQRTLAQLPEGLAGADDWARIGTTVALWVTLPLAIGAYRILRREIRS